MFGGWATFGGGAVGCGVVVFVGGRGMKEGPLASMG